MQAGSGHYEARKLAQSQFFILGFAACASLFNFLPWNVNQRLTLWQRGPTLPLWAGDPPRATLLI